MLTRPLTETSPSCTYFLTSDSLGAGGFALSFPYLFYSVTSESLTYSLIAQLLTVSLIGTVSVLPPGGVASLVFAVVWVGTRGCI